MASPSAEWIRAAAGLSSQIERPTTPENLPTLLSTARSLSERADDALTRAWSQHLFAQAQLVNGQLLDARKSFAEAASLWSIAGDADRALAAKVGQVSSETNAGLYTDVLRDTSAWSTASSLRYYNVRLNSERCLALLYLARYQEAEKCYGASITAFETLGEHIDSVNTLQPLVGLLSLEGKYTDAQRMADKGIRGASGKDAALIRGRFEIVRADLALRNGSVSEAITLLNSALADFESANDPRWQANALLKLSRLYEQLGVLPDAYAALGISLQRMSVRDAPARVAAAMVLYADLEADSSRLQSAQNWASLAHRMFSDLKMPAEQDKAHLMQIRFALAQTPASAVSNDDIEAGATSANENERSLLLARAAFVRGKLSEGKTALERLKTSTLSLHEQVELSQLDADFAEAQGDWSGAERILYDEANRIIRLSAQTSNPVLSMLLLRQIKELRRPALRLLVSHAKKDDDRPCAEKIWQWLSLASVKQRSPSPGHGSATKFDQAVAQELLSGATSSKSLSGATAQRELVSMLSDSTARTKASSPQPRLSTLNDLQRSLKDDEVFLAYVDGGDHSAVLWVGKSGVDVRPSVDVQEIRVVATALQRVIRSPDADLARISTSAAALSKILFDGHAGSGPPKRLLILTDAPLAGLPLSVLTWPGAALPLVDTTSLSFVHLSTNGPSDDSAAAVIHTIVGSQLQRNDGNFAPLNAASGEANLIRTSVGHHAMDEQTTSSTRAGLIAALSDKGAWVHVSAHGTDTQRRIGYSGIWLDPPAGTTKPDYVSWLDVINTDVTAGLVVLNACQLGNEDNAVAGNLSFATAMSDAGADQVVSALWDISDAAAAQWVPAFYASLDRDPARDTADALRTAQINLRASRAFRHPFYWAGLQATRHLNLSITAPASKERTH